MDILKNQQELNDAWVVVFEDNEHQIRRFEDAFILLKRPENELPQHEWYRTHVFNGNTVAWALPTRGIHIVYQSLEAAMSDVYRDRNGELEMVYGR